MKRLLLLVVTVTLIGCTRPGDHPLNSNCVWIEDESRPLNLAKNADRRHLRNDAVTAEDMAIRWADKYWGHLPEYEQRRDECMATLFDGVAKYHGVDVAVVRQYREERDVVADSAVILSFGVLYAIVAYIFAGWIRRGFPPDEPGFWVMTLTMSVGISLIGVMVGSLWSITIETFRLNSVHLSYRMDQIPLRQHWVVLFICSFVVFWLATLVRSRVSLRVNRKPLLQSINLGE